MIRVLAEAGRAEAEPQVVVAPPAVVLEDLVAEAVPVVPVRQLNSNPISSRRSLIIRKRRGRIATACSWITTCS